MERYVVKIKASISKDSGYETYRDVTYKIQDGWILISYSNGMTINFNMDKVYAYHISRYIEDIEEKNPWLS